MKNITTNTLQKISHITSQKTLCYVMNLHIKYTKVKITIDNIKVNYKKLDARLKSVYNSLLLLNLSLYG